MNQFSRLVALKTCKTKPLGNLITQHVFSVRNLTSTCRNFSELNRRSHLRSDKIFLRSRDTADEVSLESLFFLTTEPTYLLTNAQDRIHQLWQKFSVFFHECYWWFDQSYCPNIFPNYQ
jgi:hypothetical protein